jgi:hypothetical protein
MPSLRRLNVRHVNEAPRRPLPNSGRCQPVSQAIGAWFGERWSFPRWKPHSCRCFEPPFASDCAFGVGASLVAPAAFALEHFSIGQRDWLRLPLCHASPLPCKRGCAPPLPASVAEAPCAVATALYKAEFGVLASCCVVLALHGSASPPRRAGRSAIQTVFFLLAALAAVNCSCWSALHAPANARWSFGLKRGLVIHTSPFQLHTSALRRSLPWPALAGAPRAAGFAARILGYGHRSSFGRSTSIASIELVRSASRVAIGPLPCPSPSDAIQAPRPSFARSSMIGLPSASSSFRVANRDVLSAASRTHPVGTSTQVPPGVETLSLRQHPFARRRILPRLRRLPAAAALTLALVGVIVAAARPLAVYAHQRRV